MSIPYIPPYPLTDNVVLAVFCAAALIMLVIFIDDIIVWVRKFFHIEITVTKSDHHTPSVSNLPPPTQVLHASTPVPDASASGSPSDDGGASTVSSSYDADDDEYIRLARNRRIAQSLDPFDRVLVRDDTDERWRARFFDYYDEDEDEDYAFNCTDDNYYYECIPYAGNEHLHNTYDAAPIDPLHSNSNTDNV